MKKITGILIGVFAIAAVVLILVGNKKKMNEQTSDAAKAGSEEVVTTFTVTAEESSRTFTSNGLVQADRELNFVSEISGRVTAIYVDKGSRVAKGTPLLKVDTELLEADYKAAKAAYDALKKDEERFTNSYEAGGITSQQLDNIRTQLVAAESRYTMSKWKYENAVVKAPISGTINNRFVELGALIAPNVPLFEIVDDSRLKVNCNLSESKAALVKKGQKVTATEGGAAGRVFTGTVRNVGIKTDRGLNYPVEVLMDKDADLHPGMYLKVGFEAAESHSSILIPRKAVVGSALSAIVYVVENGKAVARPLALGDMYGDKIEIREGLREGEKVVLAGLMNISEGSAVKVVGEE